MTEIERTGERGRRDRSKEIKGRKLIKKKMM
jgi:hypothetical protein